MIPTSNRRRLLRPMAAVCAALASAALAAPLGAQTLALTPSTGTQLTTTFTVTGSGYTPNSTVRRFVNQPTWGGFREISSIQANGAGQFTFLYTPDCSHPLGTAYLYAIDGPTGRQSPTVSETILAHPSCTPQVSSVSPSQPLAGPGDQLLTVYGANFQSGLTVTVSWTGGSSTLSGTQIVNVTPSSFSMWITLGNAGQFSIRVNNPNLTQSNLFSFNASSPPPPPPPQAPTLNVSPSSGTQLTTTFTVTGSGYTPNGTVRRFVNQPTWGAFREISTIQADGSGRISWPYTPDCTNAPGTSYIYTIDGSSGRQSATVTQTVHANGACTVTISGISPGAPVARLQDQSVTVFGSNFQSGLTVTVDFANGGPVTLSGAQIQSVTPSSFVMLITLGAPGEFSIQVNNQNGSRSNTFSFSVGASTPAPAPQITSVSPQRPLVSNTDQSVTVYGNHFANGLTVLFEFPTGGTGSVAGIQVPQITPTALTMLARLGDRGRYVIRVRNADGQVSNPFEFYVDPVVPTTGTIEGRVLDDANGNGQQDAGEAFLKAPGSSCAGIAQSNLTVSLTGPTERTATLDACVSNVPYFRITGLPEGSYTLTLNVPLGARATTAASRTVSVSAGATAPRVDFRVVRGGTQPPGPASTDLAVRVAYTNGLNYELTRQDESVSFALDVTNTGAATATGVALTFFPPTALAFENLDRGAGACVTSGASVKCPVANIAPGATKSVAAWFRAVSAGRQTVKVSAAAAQADANESDNTPSLVAEVVPRHVQPLDRCQLVGVDNAHPLDPLKPTVVLTHGWSEHDAPPGNLWTSASAKHAKGMLDQKLGGRVNVVQVFWPNARTQKMPALLWNAALQYGDAKAAAPDAGACIASSLLTELRGAEYAQPIHFIGHSLGTVVNAHAARAFLSSATRVPSAQMTILDFPARVYSLASSALSNANKSHNVPKDLFVAELHKVSRILAGQLPMGIDNYYSDDGEAFGDQSALSPHVKVYNHPPLDNPKDLDEPYFYEGKGWVKPNHGGVNKWYRLSIAPDVFGINCPAWTGKASLDPCQQGWHRSLLSTLARPRGSLTEDLTADAATTTVAPDFSADAAAPVSAPATPLAFDAFLNIDNCELIADVVTCGASAESKASSLFDIPIGGKYLTFNYRFNNAGGDEYAAVFVDDEPVWVMTARNTVMGEFQTSGTLTLPARSGRHTLSILFYGAGQSTSSFELKDLATEAGVPEVVYLAEGATGSFFHTQIALMNPEPDPAMVTLQFQREDGTQISHPVTLAGTTRTTIDVETVPGLESANFATRIESTSPIVADRTMTWDASAYGSHAERSIAAPSTTWYLAEGATHGNFTLFYLLQNPDPARTAEIEVKYLLGQGEPITRTYHVPPASRMNIQVDEEPGLAEADVSGLIQVVNGVPIVVERAMYLSRPGQVVAGGHDSAGVTAPQTHWFLAEGATGSFFDTFILVANPSGTDAAVKATYLLTSGQTVVKTYTVRANSRFTVHVASEDPALASAAVSTTVESMNDVPIIVERAMWWPAGDWQEGHNSPGATSTGTKWALAEGEDGGPHETQTYVLIANTSTFEGAAKVTVVLDDGTTRERTFALTPSSRFNVAVASEFPDVAGRRFGVIVESLGLPAAEIVVERAMYSNANGILWAAGTNALATRLR